MSRRWPPLRTRGAQEFNNSPSGLTSLAWRCSGAGAGAVPFPDASCPPHLAYTNRATPTDAGKPQP